MSRIREWLSRGSDGYQHQPRVITLYWVFRVRATHKQSFLVIESPTKQEALDQLPTHDTLYSADQLREMEYKCAVRDNSVMQSWSDGFLNFYLCYGCYSRTVADEFIENKTKEFNL